MFCPRCGNEYPDTQKFCSLCGANLRAVTQMLDRGGPAQQEGEAPRSREGTIQFGAIISGAGFGFSLASILFIIYFLNGLGQPDSISASLFQRLPQSFLALFIIFTIIGTAAFFSGLAVIITAMLRRPEVKLAPGQEKKATLKLVSSPAKEALPDSQWDATEAQSSLAGRTTSPLPQYNQTKTDASG